MLPPRRSFAAVLLLLVPLSAVAEPGPRRGPPVEAVEACEALEEFDVCSFEHRDHAVSGVCMAGPRPDLPLACRPDEAPDRRRRGPPAEAIDACLDLDVDDACFFEHGDDEVYGTCKAGPKADLPLACHPDRR